jgi:secreted trypsin-like serine protease
MQKRLIVSLLAAAASAFQAQAREPSKETFKPTGAVDFDDAVRRFINKESPKIVGGQPAKDGAYPWQVSLIVADIKDPASGHFCGGSILSSTWIVTAAHCLNGLSPSQFQVVAGTYSLKSGVKRSTVKNVLIYKTYEAALAHDQDIALIELKTALKLGDKIKAISVLALENEGNTLIESKPLIVTGWGYTKEGGTTVRDLREVAVPFVTNKVCGDELSYGTRISDNMICAGKAEGGVDSCQGDSGGPLVDTGAPLLVGVVSWGDGCARPGAYGVYTRIAKFKGWIDACVAGKKCPAR